LIFDETESELAEDISRRYRIPWKRVILSSLIGALGIYLVARNLDLADLQAAFTRANLGLVLLGAATIFMTMLVKTWRWRLIFYPPESRPPFIPLFWALIFGQFLNVLLPIRWSAALTPWSGRPKRAYRRRLVRSSWRRRLTL
jgi:uncharacterized membrane protein YbhN (UPF0104 family)